jgi:hypothetical protein
MTRDVVLKIKVLGATWHAVISNFTLLNEELSYKQPTNNLHKLKSFITRAKSLISPTSFENAAYI